VVVGDDRGEVAPLLVAGDVVQLAGAEVREQDGVVLAGGDAGDALGVELLLEDGFEGDTGPFEGGRGDAGARQPVGVDVRGEEDAVGLL
jgi:hypothetical protein